MIGESRHPHKGQQSPEAHMQVDEKLNKEQRHLFGKPNSIVTFELLMIMHGYYGKAPPNNSANKWRAWCGVQHYCHSISSTANHGSPPCLSTLGFQPLLALLLRIDPPTPGTIFILLFIITDGEALMVYKASIVFFFRMR